MLFRGFVAGALLALLFALAAPVAAGVPFWGAPARDVVSTLSATRPDYDGGSLPEYRICENYLKEKKIGQPKSVWQLAYTGSVGSQTLTGIPHVHALRQAWPTSRIWFLLM